MTWSISIANDLPTLYALYSAYNASVASIANVAGISWSVTLEPLPKAFLQASARLGGNMLGLTTNPKGNSLILVDSSFTWTDDRDTATVRRAGLKLLDDIVKSAKRLGSHNDWIDVNHADYTQDPFSSYGRENQQFLQRTSKKYDESQMFQKQVPGGFKVFSR